MSQLQTIPGDNQAVRKAASDYQREFRKRVEGRICDCGQPAVRFKITGFICARCEFLENQMALGYRCGNRGLQSGAQFKPIEALCKLNQHRLKAKSKIEIKTDIDRGEDGIISTIKDLGHELVVLAHGEYHLLVA